MHDQTRPRTLSLVAITALTMVLLALPVSGTEPQPVLPVPPAGTAEYDPTQPYDPDQSDARCPAGSTRMSASGELILDGSAPPVRTSYPGPVVPVPGPVTAPPGCLADLSLTLIVKSPDERKPDGADASLDAIAVPRSALESGFDVTLPAQDRQITLSDPGPDWELLSTTCSCAGWTGSSASSGTWLASGAGRGNRLMAYPTPVVPVAPGGPGNCTGSAGAPVSTSSVGTPSLRTPSFDQAESGSALPGELTAYPQPVLPVPAVYRRPPVIQWDEAGAVDIRDPDGVGGTFSCVWTVKMAKGQLSVKTVTKPRGKEGRFNYLATPTGAQAAEASPTGLPGTSSPPRTALDSGPWSVELLDLPDAWSLRSSDCSESDGTTSSAAQGTSAVAGIDPGDRVACTFELKLRAPKPGRWRAKEGPMQVTCDGVGLSVAANSSTGRIRVRDDGDRLLGNGLGGPTWTFHRDKADPMRYTGRYTLRQGGGRATFDVDMRMINEKKLVGTTTGTGKVQGHTCKYRRTLKLTHVGN